MKGSLPMVELLLRNGADPTAVTKEGDTPVELALRMGHAEVADTLKRARLTAIDSTDAAVRASPAAAKPAALAPYCIIVQYGQHRITAVAEQDICRDTLIEKYAKGKEATVEQVRARVARALAQAEPEEQRAALGAPLPAGAGRRLHPRRPHQLRRRHRPAGDAHQLLRAAGRRLDLRGGRRQAGHLHRAAGGRRDHAPRRRRRLRLLRHPAQGRRGEGHALARQRPGVLHARLRPLVRDGRVGRLRAAARRWACCAATIPTSRNSSTPRTRATSPTSISRSA